MKILNFILNILLLQERSREEDYFLGAALIVMAIIIGIFLFIWAKPKKKGED